MSFFVLVIGSSLGSELFKFSYRSNEIGHRNVSFQTRISIWFLFRIGQGLFCLGQLPHSESSAPTNDINMTVRCFSFTHISSLLVAYFYAGLVKKGLSY